MSDDFGADLDVGETTKKSSGGISIKWDVALPVIIIILVVFLVLFKSNLFTGLIPFGSGSRILVIGTPTTEFKELLYDYENKDIIKSVRFTNAESLEHNPKERIKNYDLIILDQSLQADKSITRTLGEAINSFVNKGGKLIVVLNSGIERPDDVSVLGWKATFGNLIPVSCDKVIFGTPSCKKTYHVQGTLFSVDEDHPIVYGITQVPALDTAGYLSTETYDVSVTGNEIAYFQDARTKMTFPAIVEKPMLLGKVIYFNYNPGLSKEIFVKTIKYLS